METKYQTDSRFAKRYVILPAGMDQTVTPSNNPLIGGVDTDKFLYESLTKRGRAIRRIVIVPKVGKSIKVTYQPDRIPSCFLESAKYLNKIHCPNKTLCLSKRIQQLLTKTHYFLKTK